MTNIIGTPTKLAVRISRKLTDGQYGSFEVSAELEVNLPPDVNLEEAYEAQSAWLTAAVAKDVRGKQETVSHNAPPEPVRVPVDGDAEQDVFDVVSYEIAYSPKGQKLLKVKGGKWQKFGVTVWPEVAEQSKALEGWDSRDAGEYQVSGKLTAVVLMEGGKPKKVVGWQ